jgi:alpha-mannosidase
MAPLVEMQGDPVIVSCVKQARSGDGVVIRLLEMQGKFSQCRIRIPAATRSELVDAHLLSAVECQQNPLVITDGWATLRLRPNEITTVRLRYSAN